MGEWHIIMHPYATDSEERQRVLLFVALISIGLAVGLHLILIGLGVNVPTYIDAPGVMGFYGLMYLSFDKWLWNKPITNFLRLVGWLQVPDLSGLWQGNLTSNRTGQTQVQDYPVAIVIQQTWTHICVTLKTNTSESCSITASVLTSKPNGIVLTYQYMNEPKPGAVDTMHIHKGTVWLVLEEKPQKQMWLNGEYYSGRDRQNYGTLNVQRVVL